MSDWGALEPPLDKVRPTGEHTAPRAGKGAPDWGEPSRFGRNLPFRRTVVENVSRSARRNCGTRSFRPPKKMDKIGEYTFRRASNAQTKTRKEAIMKIHQSKLDSIGRTVAITESAAASGGSKYGNFRCLRVVVLPPGMEPAQYRKFAS